MTLPCRDPVSIASTRFHLRGTLLCRMSVDPAVRVESQLLSCSLETMTKGSTDFIYSGEKLLAVGKLSGEVSVSDASLGSFGPELPN